MTYQIPLNDICLLVSLIGWLVRWLFGWLLRNERGTIAAPARVTLSDEAFRWKNRGSCKRFDFWDHMVNVEKKSQRKVYELVGFVGFLIQNLSGTGSGKEESEHSAGSH